MALPAISERAVAMQALLHVLSEHIDSSACMLERDKSAVWELKEKR